MIFDTSKVHESWKPFFDRQDVQNMLEFASSRVGDNFTPPADKVLRFAETDLATRKVVILGQDPYPAYGAANGRSFQPDFLISWFEPFKQVSLKNIVRAVYAALNNVTEYDKIPSYTDIVTELLSGEFELAEPKEWFDSTEKQGVLWLNTSLTCKVGESNSQKYLWSVFAQELLKYISTSNPNLIWFLWGRSALEHKDCILKGTGYISRHPMMCSKAYNDDFLRNPCFAATKDIINWSGLTE